MTENVYLNGYASYDTRNLTPNAKRFIDEIFKKNGQFYKSKPKNASGDGKYVWRMVAFYAGVNPHMPVTADFDLDEHWWTPRGPETAKKRREHVKVLDEAAKEIVSHFPIYAEKGTLRWGRALGII